MTMIGAYDGRSPHVTDPWEAVRARLLLTRRLGTGQPGRTGPAGAEPEHPWDTPLPQFGCIMKHRYPGRQRNQAVVGYRDHFLTSATTKPVST